jgi:hypothetical protein
VCIAPELPHLRVSANGATCAVELGSGSQDMRAETQNLLEEIKQSVRLLRRHL